MKSIFKILLISLVSVLAACCMFACAGGADKVVEVTPDILDNTEGEVEKNWGAAYGEDPDIDNVIIDGYLDDELWTSGELKWYTHYDANSRIKYETSASLSEKGLYLAFRSYDQFVAWAGYNYFFKNTHVQFNIYASEYGGNDVQLKLDANNLNPCNWYVNARSRYHGELNQFGLGEGISAELYMTWEDMGVVVEEVGVPEEIKVMPVYRYRSSPISATTSQMLPTFVKLIGSLNQAVGFNKNGYVDGDDAGAIVGSHESGIAKTPGWTIETDDDGYEIAISDANACKGSPLAIFFREEDASTMFRVSTKIKIKQLTTDSRFGILMYRDSINYHACAFATKKVTTGNDENITLNLRGYTNYPSNITTFSQLSSQEYEMDDEIELTVYNNSGRLYYIVDGEYVASEEASYVSTNNYVGLYAFGVTAEFSEYDCVGYSSEEELILDLSEYAYTVNIYDDDESSFKVETDHIAVPKKGGVVTVTMTFTEGYTAKDIVVQYNESGEKESIKDLADQAVGGVFTLSVNESISIYSTPDLIDEEELTSIYLIAQDKETYEEVYNISATLIGDGPYARFTASAFSYGGMIMQVPKGNSWSYYAYAQEFTASEGVLFDGEILNERNEQPGIVYLKSYTLGGVARSVLDKDGREVTSLTKASTPGSVWDISSAEEGLMVFQTAGSVGANQVYFSGRTISDYQVAYAEIVNRTDPSAFTSLENDPAAGFLIAGENRTTLIALRGTGIRILQDYPTFDNTRVEANGLMSYPGQIATIDRTNGGRFVDSHAGVGSVNRIPDGDTEYVTSLLMIRKKGYVYLYACNGSANLTADKTNLSRMKHVYTYYNHNNTDYAAIGFGVTVAFNLRIDFQNFWLLTGDKAATFADDMIGENFTVNGAEFVNVDGDALISKNEDGSLVTGKIAQGSKLILTAKDTNLEDNMYKVEVLGGKTYYIHKNQTSATVEFAGNDKTCTITETEGVMVFGNVKSPDGVSRVYSGYVLNSKGDTLFDISTDSDGKFKFYAEKNAGLKLVFSLDGYVMSQTEITDAENIGALEFEYASVGGQVIRVDGMAANSNSEAILGSSKEDGLYFIYKTNAAKNGGVYVKSEYLKENMVIDYTFERNAMPMSAGYPEDLDTSIGITVYGVAGSYGIRFIGTGYRIQLNDVWNAQTNIVASDVSPVNLKGNKTSQPYNFRFIKLGEVVYMCAKLESQEEYTVVYAMNVYNHVGSLVTDVMISWATNGYADMQFSNIEIYEPETTDIVALTKDMKASDILVTGLDVIDVGGVGLISLDEETGVGRFIKTAELVVEAKDLDENEIVALYVNGTESKLRAGEKITLYPSSSSGDLIVSAVKKECNLVTGKVIAPDGVNLSAIYGLVIDEKGNEKMVVDLNEDGTFRAIVEKTMKAFVCFYVKDYVMTPVQVDDSIDLGEVTFEKTYVVSTVTLQDGTESTFAEGTRYSLNENGTVDVNYYSAKGVNNGVHIDTKYLKEDMVIYFSYERAKMPDGLGYKEDADMSMGVVFTGSTGSYGMRFIQRGYRIQRNDVYSTSTNVANVSAGSPIDMRDNPTVEPFDFKFIKVGSMVYMCAKLRSENNYVMIKEFDLMNSDFSVGSKLTDVKISWATNGWTNIRLSGIRIEDVSAENSQEIQ